MYTDNPIISHLILSNQVINIFPVSAQHPSKNISQEILSITAHDAKCLGNDNDKYFLTIEQDVIILFHYLSGGPRIRWRGDSLQVKLYGIDDSGPVCASEQDKFWRGI